MPHDIRAELSALHFDLACEAKPTLSQPTSSARMDSPPNEMRRRAGFVLDADHFLRAALFEDTLPDLQVYWHRLIVVTEMNARLGNVIGRMKVQPEHAEDDVIDIDPILIWGEQKRVITGADL